MPAFRNFFELISGLCHAVAERYRVASSASLRDLDDRTLADIGVSRSEIASIEAESRGWRGGLTRGRIVQAVSHA